ncbi:hypothetical protein BD311DRAFT_760380 [Dichomitus squalens]|uniref:Uncharacterized protein n=1 Tax=Dichomitus squalens TaxID=114155 RepID=A0A4Q9MKV0_9APHY|nr:hypothetical protein BD311DRAFT_760380 [Dichomitus squalens]
MAVARVRLQLSSAPGLSVSCRAHSPSTPVYTACKPCLPSSQSQSRIQTFYTSYVVTSALSHLVPPCACLGSLMYQSMERPTSRNNVWWSCALVRLSLASRLLCCRLDGRRSYTAIHSCLHLAKIRKTTCKAIPSSCVQYRFRDARYCWVRTSYAPERTCT